MIETSRRSEQLIRLLNQAGEIDENSVVEYKREPHPKAYKCEFLKDMLALLNSCDRPNEDRWIIYGVENKSRMLLGFDRDNSDLLDDASYQQRIESAIKPRPIIELIKVDAIKVIGPKGEGKLFAALYIPKENIGEVYELVKDVEDECPRPGKKDIRSFRAGISFIRHGSSTSPLLEEDRKRIRELASLRINQSPMTFIPTGGRLANNTLTFTDAIDNLCMLGSWDENNECDKNVITELCGMPYPAVIQMLKGNLDAGLFTIKKSIWEVQNRQSALEAIGAHLTGASLVALAKHFGSIVSSVDGKYAMPKNQRLLADVAGVNRGCSDAARKGAASFCAWLANNSRHVPNCSANDISRFVFSIMNPLFDTSDWYVIASSDSALPLFAQAFPSMYLSCVDSSLKNHCAIQEFLGQETGGIFSGHLGSGLVYGIQIAAMKGECLAQAIALLVSLSPYTEMAKDAIVEALLPWFPQTEASIESRKGMGKYLANQELPTAWTALLDLLPNKKTSTVSIPAPEYLNTCDFSKGVSQVDYWDVSRAYCQDALNGSRSSFDRMKDIVKNVESFKAAGMLREMAETLEEDLPSLNAMERYNLWNILLNYFENCKKYSSTDQGISEEGKEILESLINSYEPTDLYYKALRVCSLDDYDLAEADSYEEEHVKAVSKRVEFVALLYSEQGINSIVRLLDDGAKGRLLGEALAHLDITADDEQSVLALLDAGQAGEFQQLDTARSYAWTRFKCDGWSWFNLVALDGWQEERIARLLASLPFSKECWEKAEAILGECSIMYWKEATAIWVSDNSEDLSHCVGSLLAANRAEDALELIKHSLDNGVYADSELIFNAISGINSSNLNTMTSYYIQELFEHLEEKDAGDQLCELEFRFADLLREKPNAYLFKRMSQDPQLFVDVVDLANNAPSNEEDNDSESIDTRWIVQYRILRNWITTPGLNDEGEFDKALFNKWIEESRKLADGRGLLKSAELEIGRNLFHAKRVDESFFMPEVAAAFIESSDAALSGYTSEALNSRGVHFVDPTGQQEDAIADSYDVKAREAEEHGYARFAAKLRSIAKSYRREAEENRSGE